MQRLAILFLVFAVPCSLHAQAKPAPPASSQNDVSCRAFVQDFYNWYIKIINSNSNLDGTDLIIKFRKTSFDPELLRQLKLDEDANAKAKEIVGLDFDPFVDAQEFADKYQAGKVTIQGSNCLVEVRGFWGKDNVPIKNSNKKAQEPDVIPELAFRNGAWVFVNFHYPNQKNQQDQDLLVILKSLRDERQKHRK